MSEELFEIFDDAGRPLGLKPRSEVHREGWWHRSAHVWLFHSDGRLWLQQRAPGKDLFPDCWDFSVGEHLQPGECFLAGAQRGLREELQVADVSLQALASPKRQVQALPALGILDREETQSFRGSFDGPLHPDPDEVAAVRLLTIDQLASEYRQAPDRFTPWMIEDGIACGLLPATLAQDHKP